MEHSKAPTLDSLHRCLADTRRRYVLSYVVRSEDGTASIDDLVDHIVAEETNSPTPDRTQIEITLHHIHLPMLADNSLIEFDRRSETVRYTPGSAQEHLEVMLSNDEENVADKSQ